MTIKEILVVAGLVASMAGCSVIHPTPHSTINTGPDGLRTFTWVSDVNRTPLLCNAAASVDPVDGILRGDPDDTLEPIWIEDAVGRRLSVVWPAGFTVTFEPAAVLRDDRGTVVARTDGPVELSQVSTQDHVGTFEDPYIASGILFNGCYWYLG
jgi:hypothetical protein